MQKEKEEPKKDEKEPGFIQKVLGSIENFFARLYSRILLGKDGYADLIRESMDREAREQAKEKYRHREEEHHEQEKTTKEEPEKKEPVKEKAMDTREETRAHKGYNRAEIPFIGDREERSREEFLETLRKAVSKDFDKPLSQVSVQFGNFPGDKEEKLVIALLDSKTKMPYKAVAIDDYWNTERLTKDGTFKDMPAAGKIAEACLEQRLSYLARSEFEKSQNKEVSYADDKDFIKGAAECLKQLEYADKGAYIKILDTPVTLSNVGGVNTLYIGGNPVMTRCDFSDFLKEENVYEIVKTAECYTRDKVREVAELEKTGPGCLNKGLEKNGWPKPEKDIFESVVHDRETTFKENMRAPDFGDDFDRSVDESVHSEGLTDSDRTLHQDDIADGY